MWAPAVAEARLRVADDRSMDKILRFFNADSAAHVVDRMLHTDLMTRIPDHLLALVDRMTMAHSLENRSPLIDYRVVEFAARIPAELKLKGGQLKYLLKQVAARYLPPDPRNPGGDNWALDPDTTGGNYREVEILPSSLAADTTWNCVLYVDHHDDRPERPQHGQGFGHFLLARPDGGH